MSIGLTVVSGRSANSGRLVQRFARSLICPTAKIGERRRASFEDGYLYVMAHGAIAADRMEDYLVDQLVLASRNLREPL